MSTFVVVHGAGVTAPGPLEALLADRGRPTTIVAAQAAPTTAEGVRALVLRGDPGSHLDGLVRACAEAGVCVLGIGTGAAAVAQALGAPLAGATPQPPTRVTVDPTAEGRDHGVAGPLPAGAPWLTDLAVTGAQGWTVLAVTDAGAPALAARDRATVTTLRGDLSLPELAALLEPTEPEGRTAVQAARFLLATGAALLGRWIDREVGRSAEEMPWGRRGPGPVPRPGLFLHPA